jgi:hypothetical protein
MRQVGWNRRELKEMGYVVSRDGSMLDNRDGFYDDYQYDFIRTFDCRTRDTYNPQTHIVMSRSLWEKIAHILEAQCST